MGGPSVGTDNDETVSLGGHTVRQGAEDDYDAHGRSLAAGETVGRYVVRDEIGAGGMGVVYLADDPELERRVALKLILPPRNRETHTTEGAARLLREAQALAKFSHPNVIRVFDVGSDSGRVFIAMEFVQGPTLNRWIALNEPSVAEVLAQFVAAGRGLAAAHAIGIVHRDFKPSNVIVADDGRTRVLDFGLATPTGHSSMAHRSESGLGDGVDDYDPRVTATGMAMGSPAYMAPEQHHGDALDARSDQFSFCVALWEGLYGTRLFPGQSVGSLLAKKLGQEYPDLPADKSVPARVHRAMLRGLQPDPDRRHPSMAELLQELEHKRPAPLATWMIGGGMLVAAGVAAASVLLDDTAVCAQGRAAVLEAYDADDRRAIEAAFGASTLRYASSAHGRLQTKLDAYANELAEARTAACEAQQHETADAAASDQTVACLRQRTDELRLIATAAVSADDAFVQRAARAAGSLSSISSCQNAVDAKLRPTPEQAAAVEQVRARLSGSRVLQDTGQNDEALRVAEQAVARAAEIGFDPLRAEAMLRRGLVLVKTGKYEASRTALTAASDLAVAIGHDDVAATASSQLVFVVGVQLSQLEDAEVWARHAHAAVDRAGRKPRGVATLEGSLGQMELRRGNFDAAQGHLETALELREQLFARNHPAVTQTLDGLGNIHAARGNHVEARRWLQDSLDRTVEYFGEGHPETVGTLANFATVCMGMGEFDEAIAALGEVLVIVVESRGPDHPDVSRIETNLANARFLMGDKEGALAGHQRALAGFKKSLGPRAALVGRALNNSGVVLQELGRFDEAETSYQGGLEITEEHLGADHPEVASAHTNLGSLALQVERWADAAAGFERGLAIYEGREGKEHAYNTSLVGLGRAHLGMNETAKAVEALNKAKRLLRTTKTQVDLLGVATFALARAHWSLDDHEQAIVEAESAHAAFEEAGEASAAQKAEVSAWLAEHAN